ncbi:phosphatase regulatory subunit domain-containing protein [Ceratobasidium sp. AG-Ba]|nr:phosphatase regulatory subunit domain-containing protein [Ceratobasidium sp. AG-Ba]
MMMTASATTSPAPNMTSARRERRHHRSASGSSFSFSDDRGAFSPLTNLPRRARSIADVATVSPPQRSSSTSPSRQKKASFTLGSSDEDDDEDCPLVREVNQRARVAKLTDEHFGDFSFDAEAHKAKTSQLAQHDESETETEADFPPTPVGDAPPTPSSPSPPTSLRRSRFPRSRLRPSDRRLLSHRSQFPMRD